MNGETLQIPREDIVEKLHEHAVLLTLIEEQKARALCTIRDLLGPLAVCHNQASCENTILQRLLTCQEYANGEYLSTILQENPICLPTPPYDVTCDVGKFYKEVESFRELAHCGLLMKQSVAELGAVLEDTTENGDLSHQT